MKLAISNIAWTPEEEPEVATTLKALGVTAIEIAPTKIWDEPIDAPDDMIKSYKEWWASYGIEIVAFQSMLFTHPEYELFASEQNRSITANYLKDFTVLAGKIGAERMVFGSPKNRQKRTLSDEDSMTIATQFFSEIADVASKNSTIFCIEPNAPQYNCDFITTAQQGIEIVKRVKHEGFGLHLDTACMALAGDDIAQSIRDGASYLKHFHMSAPMLDLVTERGDVDYRAAANALEEIQYDGYISIEMRPGDIGKNVERVSDAVKFVSSIYAA